MLLFIELFAAFFYVILAWLAKWPNIKFRESGATSKMEDDYHTANGWIIGMFISLASALMVVFHLYMNTCNWFDFIVLPLLFLSWAGVVFDVALNKFTDRKVFYVGGTAKTDKQVRKLGKYAGQIKAGVCLVLIAGLNILYYVL